MTDTHRPDAHERDAHGTFVWYELLSSDPDAAQRFYADVLGWAFEDSGHADMDYHYFRAPDGDGIGGLMRRTDGMPGGSSWLGYIAVDDVDAAIERIEANGGQVHMPAKDVPQVGRIAMVADGQGGSFYLMRGASSQLSRSFVGPEQATPGHAVWNELSSPDTARAVDFYAATLDWRQEGSMPLGERGDYLFMHAGAIGVGGFMGGTPTDPPDGWTHYFLVADLDEAIDRIAAGGGKLVNGPDEIPGGDFSIGALDPQGARFGLVGPSARTSSTA